MNSTISPIIANSERLYRAIFLDWWNFKTRSISHAAFLDDKGVSVSRASGRPQSEMISDLRVRFSKKKKLKAVASLSAGACRKLDTFIYYSQHSKNIYHAAIWNSETEIALTQEKAFNLSRKVRFDFIDEQMNS